MVSRSNLVIGAALAVIAALCVTAVAQANGEARIKLPGIPPSQYQINPKTCRFIHREIDPKTPKASLSLAGAVVAINDLRVYALYEDARHDAKMACLAHHLTTKRTVTNTGLVGYVQVTASGTGESVTATCPAGDVVLGGGSPDETTGSYPSSKSAWTIRRDHLSPKRMTVVATCAKAAS